MSKSNILDKLIFALEYPLIDEYFLEPPLTDEEIIEWKKIIDLFKLLKNPTQPPLNTIKEGHPLYRET